MGIGLENPFKEKTGYQSAIEIKSLLPLHNKVIVTEMDFSGRKLSSGIMLLNDDGKTDGIRPRWAKIYAVGPEQKDVVPGQWVLVEHGRWSRGIKVIIDGEETVIRLADPECLIFVSDVPPDSDETISTSVYAERKER
jgi:co-chaperonin GroES (HSP10)